MEQLTQFAINYWPYILGASFVLLIAINFRSWLAGQKSEG